MSLFKKPKNRKFKQRSKAGSDEEDEPIINLDPNEDDVQRLDEPVSTAGLPSADQASDDRKEAGSHKTKLSFVQDDEVEEVFKVKRSNSSLKALKQLERKKKEAKKLAKQNELINQTKSVRKLMETNKESLEEANTKSMPFQQQTGVINLDEVDVEDEDGSDDYLRFKKPSTGRSDASIPDNKTIEMLKRQRFLAKDSGEEYISLSRSSASKDAYMNSESSNSRLIREEPSDKEAICIDDDEEGDMDDDRVSFYSDKSNLQKERIKEAFFNAQNEDLNEQAERRFKDSDDELDLWEQSQIRKGVSLLQQQKDLRTNDLSEYALFTNQRGQMDPFEPPPYIKLTEPALSKDRLLAKYREQLQMVTSKLDYLHNQFRNIELTIGNIKESLDEGG